MSGDEYLFGAPMWLLPALGITLVLGLISLAGYWREPSPLRWIAWGCKLLALLIMTLCLAAPMARGYRPKPQANLLPVVVDQSFSMQMQGSRETDKLSSKVMAALQPDCAWMKASEQAFDVRRYQFSQRLEPIDSFEGVVFDGTSSSLGTALRTLVAGYAARPVAGCLIFTDGNSTDHELMEQFEPLPFPIYPITDLRKSEACDLRIGGIISSETAFEASPITIDARISALGCDAKQAVVRLLDESGSEVERQILEIQAGIEEYPVRFRFRPSRSGITFYRVQVRFRDEARKQSLENSDWFGGPTVESTLLNNQKWVAVNQRRGPFDILYVAGRPNWEFKYLRRSLDEDAELRLVGLLRIAKSQPKFSFRDTTIRSSANPLFAGLGGEEEEIAEQSDEAVLLRVGVEESQELAGGFPDSAEGLFSYSAIIIDDLEAAFFTQDQLALLRQFISRRGGAVLFLGGEESFQRGDYDRGPIGELVPIYLNSGDSTLGPAATSRPAATFGASEQLAQDRFRLNLTREGMLQPFLRLRKTEEEEINRLRNMPPLRVINEVGRIKPGAVVLATAETSQSSTQPALVTQSFGRGKTAAFLPGDVWRWFLQRPQETASRGESGRLQQTDPGQFWRQLNRWLVSDVPRKITAEIRPGETAETLLLCAETRDDAFEPLDSVQVQWNIDPPEGAPVMVVAQPSLETPGKSIAEYWPRHSGVYRARVTVTDEEGDVLGTDEVGWVSDPVAEEVERLGIDIRRLESLANRSGGEVVDINEIDRIVEFLETRPVPVQEVWVYPLWHRTWVCLLALACLCGEWGIRRWKGMA